MDYELLSGLLFPDVMLTPEDVEKSYPKRNLPEGAKVTRFAPSPTGFIHLGGIYGAMIDISRAAYSISESRIPTQSARSRVRRKRLSARLRSTDCISMRALSSARTASSPIRALTGHISKARASRFIMYLPKSLSPREKRIRSSRRRRSWNGSLPPIKRRR